MEKRLVLKVVPCVICRHVNGGALAGIIPGRLWLSMEQGLMAPDPE